MLTGNRPPALITTHPYWQQPRWRRLVDPTQLDRHAAIHHGDGPTTAQRLNPQQPSSEAQPAAAAASTVGRLGQALAATYPPAERLHEAHDPWGPAGNAIPDQLPRDPAAGWPTIELPDVDHDCGIQAVDLADPATRRYILPRLLEHGPADLLTCFPLPQLSTEWAYLELPGPVRDAWEACYPTLASDPPNPHQLSA